MQLSPMILAMQLFNTIDAEPESDVWAARLSVISFFVAYNGFNSKVLSIPGELVPVLEVLFGQKISGSEDPNPVDVA